jgi:hypothetical protein
MMRGRESESLVVAADCLQVRHGNRVESMFSDNDANTDDQNSWQILIYCSVGCHSLA